MSMSEILDVVKVVVSIVSLGLAFWVALRNDKKRLRKRRNDT